MIYGDGIVHNGRVLPKLVAEGYPYLATPVGTENDCGATVAYTSSTSITISSPPFAFTEHNVSWIVQVSTTGVVTNHVERGQWSVAAGGGTDRVITVANGDFDATDEFLVCFFGPDKSYDESGDTDRVSIVSRYEAEDVCEEVLSSTNDDTNTFYSDKWNGLGYRHTSIEIACSGGVTPTVWVTNNPSPGEATDADWVDSGWAPGADSHEMSVFADSMFRWWRIKYVTTDATNAIDAWACRYN